VAALGGSPPPDAFPMLWACTWANSKVTEAVPFVGPLRLEELLLELELELELVEAADDERAATSGGHQGHHEDETGAHGAP